MAQLEVKVMRQKPNVLKALTSWAMTLFRRGTQKLIGLWNREVVVDINSESAIKEGFEGNTAVYSIVKKDAKKFSSIPRYLLDKKKMEKALKPYPKEYRHLAKIIKALESEVKINNKLSKLLERPNPYQGQAAFLKQLRAYYKVCGEGFIELNRGEIFSPQVPDKTVEVIEVVEMYVLPSHLVSVIPDPENVWGVLGYEIREGGFNRFIHRKNVIHWKDINLSWDAITREHMRGMSGLKPGEETLTANQEGERATVRAQQNDGAKGAVYGKEKVTLNPTQEAQLRGTIDNKVNNAAVRGSVASIFGIGELGYINFGGTAVDMQLTEMKDQSWKYLCALLDVPYLLFNPSATYANLLEAKKNWINDSIMPDCKELDDELARVLLRAFQMEDTAIIASDFTELPELQADMKLLSEWLNMSDEITPNEKRIAKGYEPRDESQFDEPWIKTGAQPLSDYLASTEGGMDALFGSLGVSKPGQNGRVVPGGVQNGKIPPKSPAGAAKAEELKQ